MVCPELSEGDLVVTEVGGPQTGQELLRPFIELYNASGESVDLRGIRVRFRRATGADIGAFIVRRQLEAAPASYTTLGLDADPSDAAEIDYGFSSDFHVTFPPTAVLQVEACDTRIDQLAYDSLPKVGTYSYGEMPPTADGNDIPTRWCTDATANVGDVPGTPQRANPPCP